MQQWDEPDSLGMLFVSDFDFVHCTESRKNSIVNVGVLMVGDGFVHAQYTEYAYRHGFCVAQYIRRTQKPHLMKLFISLRLIDTLRVINHERCRLIWPAPKYTQSIEIDSDFRPIVEWLTHTRNVIGSMVHPILFECLPQNERP